MAKKIGAIVSLSIIGILILATIIMANVNVDYSINCAKPASVWIQKGSEGERLAKSPNKIIELIDNASKEKALTALFNGTINQEATLIVSSTAGKTVPSTTGYYVRYSYDNTQKTKDNNDKTVSYEELLFTVGDLEGTQIVKVYVIPNRNNAMTYTHYYELEADFSNLFDYLEDKGSNA